MNSTKKNNSVPKAFGIAVLAGLMLSELIAVAEGDNKATIKLSFSQTDSTKTAKAVVRSDTGAAKGVEVHFYAQRSFHNLPIGKAVETDENGEATMSFPIDLPGDKDGNIIVIAKIEDDDSYGTVEMHSEVKWGKMAGTEYDKWDSRSLSASREKAPMILIIVSNLIIAVIWGIIIYVFLQVFKIKKLSKLANQKPVKLNN